MVTKASKVQAKPPTANRQRDGRRRTRSARTVSAVAVRHYGTFSIRVVKSAFAKNLQNNALTHIRASIENRTEAVHSACDAKSEEHRRRRQEVKSARSGQSTVYVHSPFWTQTVTFSRWSPRRSRRAVLGRAACRRQAANLRVVCSLPSLRKREVTRSEPQNRGDQVLDPPLQPARVALHTPHAPA